jgi:hypothetical protein
MIDGAPQDAKGAGFAELSAGNLFLFQGSGTMHKFSSDEDCICGGSA